MIILVFLLPSHQNTTSWASQKAWSHPLDDLKRLSTWRPTISTGMQMSTQKSSGICSWVSIFFFVFTFPPIIPGLSSQDQTTLLREQMDGFEAPGVSKSGACGYKFSIPAGEEGELLSNTGGDYTLSQYWGQRPKYPVCLWWVHCEFWNNLPTPYPMGSWWVLLKSTHPSTHWVWSLSSF